MNDEDWHEKVEEHLLRDLIEDLQEKFKEHDAILKGEKRNSGLLAEYSRHDELLRRMYAVIWQDPTGQKGLLHDVDTLMGRSADHKQERESKWKFWTAVTVAIISSATLVLTHLKEIQSMIPKDHPDKVSQMIEEARHPKPKHRHYTLRIPAEEATE